jgi:hypothetical protein
VRIGGFRVGDSVDAGGEIFTIAGSVANLIVVESAKLEMEIGFRDYFRAGLPVTLVTLLVGWGWLEWVRSGCQLSRSIHLVPMRDCHNIFSEENRLAGFECGGRL